MTTLDELAAEARNLLTRIERLQEEKTKAPCPLEEGKDVRVNNVSTKAAQFFSVGVYGYVSVKANSHVSDAYSVNIEIPWGYDKSITLMKARQIIGSASD